MTIIRAFAIFFTGLLMLAAPLSPAHEFWLEPASFFLKPGEATAVRMFVGDGLQKDREERSYERDKAGRYFLQTPTDQRNLMLKQADRSKPVYNFSEPQPGNYLLLMERKWSFIKLDAHKFEQYLREDGMDYIIAERKQRGESRKEGRERYQRFLKTLIQVGEVSDATYNKWLGSQLEIVPLANPYRKKIGDTLQLQVTFDGLPLAGKTVFADNIGSATQKMVTDADGRVTMKIDKDGLWLVRLVFMQRCRNNCGEADWESFWSALTFGAKP